MMVRTMAAALVLLTTGAFANDVVARAFTFTYNVEITDIPDGAESVRLWIPVPKSTDYQYIGNVVIEGADDYYMMSEPEYGNHYAIVDVPAGTKTFNCAMTFDAQRRVRSNLSGDVEAINEALEERDKYLRGNRLVLTDGIIAEEAQRVAGGVADPLGKARALYDHIVSTVRYDKSGEGWGRGDTTYACDTRAGNCTDFHSLFIGEARSQEIPSRFLMGFSVPTEPEGTIGGYHCWAEFHIDGRGWIPIDASEAFKAPERKEELFGGLDQNRVQFTIGRDITLPEMQGEALNYSIYPYVEVDGEPFDSVAKSFFYRNK